MQKEIERKFLVKSTDFKLDCFEALEIKQGFLNTHKKRTVRIRITNNKAFITVKGKSSKNGLTRLEWEKEIPVLEAEQLLNLCEKYIIVKKRYKIKVANHIYEVDEFFGKNKGLILAEIELSSESEKFTKPIWLGKEVTGDKRYYNSVLSKKPFSKW